MRWTACYSTPSEATAHLVKGYLEQYGVPCIIENLRFSMEPLTFCALGEARVLVHEDWLHIARGLLRGRERTARATRGRRVVL
jgi:hypothetical protein